jgi:mannose-6-phosphate isomerase
LQKNYEELDSFVIYICLEGSMVLTYGGDKKIGVTKGEIILLPAVLNLVKIYPEKKVKFLEVFIR